MAEIEIDGNTYQAEDGEMVIEVADREGIHIPRFCYHKKLSIAANCRMCLVEVEKSPKALPACATPIMHGMKVFTQSPAARDAQHSVMEFLLINHPLDCPICDQGGECELQDVAMGYGTDDSFYDQGKRVVKDENIGALVSTEMTRCIHCTRCIRFGEEVAGVPELGLTSRGEHARVETYVEASLKSELSGNIIDLCPVGALTAKPSRFTARAWEMQQQASISPHDCVGTNVYAHTRRGQVMRVVPKENEAVNETWISDRDRFSYLGLTAADRQSQPMIKQQGKWQAVDWSTAFEAAVNGMKKIVAEQGASQLGALVSPHSTLEEMYLLQKVMRGLGSDNIDHRLHQTDFSDQDSFSDAPGLNGELSRLAKCDAFLLVGSHIYREQPLIGNRLRSAVRSGAKACVVNPMDFDIHFDIAELSVTPLDEMAMHLAMIAKALSEKSAERLPADAEKLLQTVSVSPSAQAIADTLLSAKRPGVFMGAIAMNHSHAAEIRSMVYLIAKLCGVADTCSGIFTEGGNAQGAWLAGAVPHRQLSDAGYQTANGLNAAAQLATPLKGYLLFNVEPERDCANPYLAQQALAAAECVIHISPFLSDTMKAHADVFLPIGPFTETSGTYVNVSRHWQSTKGVCQPMGESRPGWKVLRVLANQLSLAGFSYESSQDVTDEIINQRAAQSEKPVYAWHCPTQLTAADTKTLHRLGCWDIYSVDQLVRRSAALQAVYSDEQVACYLAPAEADQRGLTDGQQVTVKQGAATQLMSVIVDERLPARTVYLVSGKAETVNLGSAFGLIEIAS